MQSFIWKKRSLMLRFSLLLLIAFTFFAAAPASATLGRTIKVGWILYSGDYNGDPTAAANVHYELEARTGEDVVVENVVLGSIEVVEQYDLLILTGHNTFAFTAAERMVLKAYLDGCGTLFIDDCNNAIDTGFEPSVRGEISGILGTGFLPLPTDHAVFSSFYTLTTTPPTMWNGEALEGIVIDGQTRVIYSDNDYTCGWENYAGQPTIENSYQVAANILMFSTTNVCVVPVTIDIKPGSDPNSINLGSNGNVPVAIFSAADFDATTIDLSTVKLTEAFVAMKANGTMLTSLDDVNGDGLTDLIVHFDTDALELTLGDISAVLTGKTYDGVPFEGSDSVRIVPAAQ